jgi:hypothetical protein
MDKTSENKPLPQPLFVPIEFWSEIMLNLDKRVKVVTEDFGYGEVGLIIKIHKEKILEVKFTDEIRVRGIIAKAGNKGADSYPQGSDSTLIQHPTTPTTKTE